jgi:methionine-rich copper-binding protein CopC
VVGDVPPSITLSAPAQDATVAAGPSTLTWNDQVDSSWYRVAIINPRGGSVDEAWHDGAEICEGGVCSLTVDLVPGAYLVRIAGWNPAGLGPAGSTTFTVTP